MTRCHHLASTRRCSTLLPQRLLPLLPRPTSNLSPVPAALWSRIRDLPLARFLLFPANSQMPPVANLRRSSPVAAALEAPEALRAPARFPRPAIRAVRREHPHIPAKPAQPLASAFPRLVSALPAQAAAVGLRQHELPRGPTRTSPSKSTDRAAQTASSKLHPLRPFGPLVHPAGRTHPQAE